MNVQKNEKSILMRNRLIELCENLILSCKSSLCEDCEHKNIDYPNCMSVHFADHLLANGVIVPPYNEEALAQLEHMTSVSYKIRNAYDFVTTVKEEESKLKQLD